MDELKPCPFCGGVVKLMAIAGEPYPPTYEVDITKINVTSDDVCFVHCPTCGANWHITDRMNSFPLDTLTAWNRRPTPENRPLTLEELRLEIETSPKGWLWLEDLQDSENSTYQRNDKTFQWSNLTNYGKTWLTYASKPEVE